MNPLQKRLSALRRRLRLVVSVRGSCRLLAILLFAVCLAGVLDWRFHLPSLVRACILVGVLAGFGVYALRWLIRPLAEPTDDLSLALAVEKTYPHLNDSLASAVQFLQQPKHADDEASSLREEAIRQTLRDVRDCDFQSVVSARGLGLACLGMLVAGALAVGLWLAYPDTARTAFARLAVPFGAVDWPTKTQLELEFATRIARGEAFEIRGQLAGLVPDQALIVYDGLSPSRQNVTIRRQGDSGSLLARVERVERSFQFKVYANDVTSGWYYVDVQPPPVLVPLSGRASPQVRLTYPKYTGFPPQNLPDGTGNIVLAPVTDPNAPQPVHGTLVGLTAAVDRPLARAWIEFRPDHPLTARSAFAGLLGAGHPLGLVSALAGAREVSEHVPARLGPDGKTFAVNFLPRVNGMYALRFEDTTGLGNTRLFELRLLPDPAPVVNLERPSRSRDSLYLLPDAEFNLQLAVRDPQFAVRSAYLQYRRRTSSGDEDAPRRLMLYDQDRLGAALPALAAAFGGPLRLPTHGLVLRPKVLDLRRRVTLKSLGFPPLQEGDIVTLQAFADDFDDVTVNKAPGRSHEVELLIVSPPTLEARINEAQKGIENKLQKLRKEQQAALDRVIAAEQHWRNTGRLKPSQGEKTDHLDQVFQAEQQQQQIRAQIGNRENGLRAEVERILQTMKDNKLPRSGSEDRMQAVANELERLAQEELPQIEPELTNARKADELAIEPKPPAKNDKGALGAARERQEEVERTLGELLKLLEPWGNINSVKGETKNLLDEQRRFNEHTKNLANPDTRGLQPEELTPEQRAALDGAAELQRKLAERVGQLLDKIERTAKDRRASEPELAEALKEAANKGRDGAVQDGLGDAGEKIKQNNLGAADKQQQAGIKTLEEMVKALEQRREQELDRLGNKIDEARNDLQKLQEEQDRLRKKIKEAQKLGDPEKRAAELKRLAGEQQKLQEKAEELEQRLKFLKANKAQRQVAAAAAGMQQAARQLDNGEDPEENEQEALDRLNEARQNLEEREQEVRDELAREKLAKIADRLKLLRQRQESIVNETSRIQARVERKKEWDRVSLTTLGDLALTQKSLGLETDQLAEGKLAGATVFARILTKAADAMIDAADLVEKDRARVGDDRGRTKLDPAILKRQEEALRHFDFLLDALKEELAKARPPGGNQEGQQPGQQEGGPRAPADGIPQLAQLKALRALQQDVNERTAEFGRNNPDLDKLTPESQRELLDLRRDQEEIGELFHELTAQAEGAPQ